MCVRERERERERKKEIKKERKKERKAGVGALVTLAYLVSYHPSLKLCQQLNFENLKTDDVGIGQVSFRTFQIANAYKRVFYRFKSCRIHKNTYIEIKVRVPKVH